MLVCIKPSSGLSAEVTRLDIFFEKRAGAVLGVAETFVEDVQNRQTRIQSNQVGQRQRTHRVIHA